MEYSLKKSLGQHFLKDEQIGKNIVAGLQGFSFQNLLEIGPGGGALTRYLLQLPEIGFKAIELDEEKVRFLEKTWPSLKSRIITGDILQAIPPFSDEFVVIGNFPYNISSQILFKILDWKSQVPLVIGMFQKEVAERIVSRSGNKVYGILSILIQAFYEAEYLFDVPPTAFHPPPKVMSGVIRLQRKRESILMKDEKSLFILVKAAFNQRRKMMRNAVKGLFDEPTLADPLFSKRAEQLDIEQFGLLTFRMK